MGTIKVVVHGASGKMGREVVSALCPDPDVELVGAIDKDAPSSHLDLPDGSGSVPFSTNLEHILTGCKPDVLVDFTIAPATMPAVRSAVKHGVNLVIGTSGLTPKEIGEIDELARAHQVGAVVAPNFALGAVLMIHLAQLASKYLDYAEIIELHHHKKVDSPSGTAIATAKAMLKARGRPFVRPAAKGDSASRGKQVEGIAIHSVRLPGLLAQQEVLLGGAGQTLSIKHATISRECFMPGVILAIKEVVKLKGLVYGLDSLLGL